MIGIKHVGTRASPYAKSQAVVQNVCCSQAWAERATFIQGGEERDEFHVLTEIKSIIAEARSVGGALGYNRS